jgi:hypothetical protein
VADINSNASLQAKTCMETGGDALASSVNGNAKAERGSIGSAETGQGAGAGRFDVGEVLLGRYRILGKLGRGGMGVVYRCHDEVSGIDVAFKALPPELSHDAEEMVAVQDNFRLVEKLHHPNIAAAKTLERDDATGNYYLIMECVAGRSLSAYRNSRGGRLPPTEVVAIAAQIARALDYAHSRKVIHRDIKPSNVMITFEADAASDSDETVPARAIVKVLDFGLAAQIYTSLSRVSKADYGTSGTGPYMAPEQWLGQYQDAATDQYALAVLVYELLSGRPPFVGHDMRVLSVAVLTARPEAPKNVGAGLWKVLKKGLAKKRKDRYASCSAFTNALIGNCPGAGTVAGEGSRKRRGLLMAASALLLAAACFAGWRYGYLPRAEQRDKARDLVGAAATQEAARRARIAELKSEAETALSAGKLETADVAIAALEDAGEVGVASKLRIRREDLAGEGETDRRFEPAFAEYGRAAALDRGQGFGPRLDVLEATWREAEAARQARQWDQAQLACTKVQADGNALMTLDRARQKAAAEQKRVIHSKEEARGSGADADAVKDWATGVAAQSEGDRHFERGDFPAAMIQWDRAAKAFEQAVSRAGDVREYRLRRKAYRDALAKEDVPLLEDHGGTAWQKVASQAGRGDAMADSPAEGAQAYDAALTGLPGAVRAAREAHTSHMARIRAAEEEQQRAAQRKREEEQKQLAEQRKRDEEREVEQNRLAEQRKRDEERRRKAVPPPPVLPPKPPNTVTIAIMQPGRGTLSIGNRTYELSEQPMIHLTDGPHDLVLQIPGLRRTIYGQITVHTVNEETERAVFGMGDARNGVFFPEEHLKAADTGRPVNFSFDFRGSGGPRLAVSYKLTLVPIRSR